MREKYRARWKEMSQETNEDINREGVKRRKEIKEKEINKGKREIKKG